MGQCFSAPEAQQSSDGKSNAGAVPSAPAVMPQEFKYEILAEGTQGFHKTCILGEGGFGKVYKGQVLLGQSGTKTDVAVKVLNGSGTKSGYREWVTEVLMLERLSHPNLVRLLGYCAQGEMAFLIYEFVPNRALNHHLFATRNIMHLGWEQRLKIAEDAATGLEYLHTKNIIHRDMKAANILLDDTLVAKVSDFGLAKVGPVGEQSFVETKVKGTPGYIDPSYMERGHLTAKSDVYAFGVILLELLTGRHAMDGEDGGPLADWIRDDVKGFSLDLVDERVRETVSEKGAKKVFTLARTCIQSDPEPRPSMPDVLSTIRLIRKM